MQSKKWDVELAFNLLSMGGRCLMDSNSLILSCLVAIVAMTALCPNQGTRLRVVEKGFREASGG